MRCAGRRELPTASAKRRRRQALRISHTSTIRPLALASCEPRSHVNRACVGDGIIALSCWLNCPSTRQAPVALSGAAAARPRPPSIPRFPRPPGPAGCDARLHRCPTHKKSPWTSATPTRRRLETSPRLYALPSRCSDASRLSDAGFDVNRLRREPRRAVRPLQGAYMWTSRSGGVRASSRWTSGRC